VATVLGAALLIALLAWAVDDRSALLLHVDGAVADALYGGDDRSGLVDGLLRVATAPGLFVVRAVVYLPVLAWLLLRARWWTAGWVAAAVWLISPVTTLIKDTTGRLRPQFADGGARYSSLSFPSGHASGVATLVTVALLLSWPLLAPRARLVWLAAGVALAVLVGLTRIWLGVHWLSDVVAGEALGVAWTLLMALVFGGLPGSRGALPPAGSAASPEVVG
jgi:membrane-associated phospholipid phosphatase